MFIEKVTAVICEQQENCKGTPAYYAGEQLKEICKGSERIAEIVYTDLQNPDMSIQKAEAQIKKYADDNHKGARSFCVPPDVAEGILRKFYGIDEIPAETPKKSARIISLDDFIV
jgi:hypothetical protein